MNQLGEGAGVQRGSLRPKGLLQPLTGDHAAAFTHKQNQKPTLQRLDRHKLTIEH
jgi:hypothetical protein